MGLRGLFYGELYLYLYLAGQNSSTYFKGTISGFVWKNWVDTRIF